MQWKLQIVGAITGAINAKKITGPRKPQPILKQAKKVLQKIEELMLESIFQPLKKIPRFAIVKFFDSIDRLIEQVNFFQLNAEPN